MPGFDGRGPRGLGPGTGGRRGVCFTGSRTYNQAGRGARGLWGGGWGRRCIGGWLGFRAAPYDVDPTAVDDTDMLRRELEQARNQVAQMESRLADLEQAGQKE